MKEQKNNKYQKTDFQISKENELTSWHLQNAKVRLQCIKKIYPKMFKFHPSIKSHKGRFRKPDFSELKTSYEKLTRRLSTKNLASISTASERTFLKKLQYSSKKKTYQNLWIGTHNIDLFIPNIHNSKISHGLAIEIDGDVHDFESKMKKDEQKGEQLKSLGIATTHIKNWELDSASLDELKRKHNLLKTLDSRARQRLWTKIYAITLACHLSDDEFFQIFRPITNHN